MDNLQFNKYKQNKYEELKKIENELYKKQVEQAIQTIEKSIPKINNSKKKDVERIEEKNKVVSSLIDFYNETEDYETYSKLRNEFFKNIELPKINLMC